MPDGLVAWGGRCVGWGMGKSPPSPFLPGGVVRVMSLSWSEVDGRRVLEGVGMPEGLVAGDASDGRTL